MAAVAVMMEGVAIDSGGVSMESSNEADKSMQSEQVKSLHEATNPNVHGSLNLHGGIGGDLSKGSLHGTDPTVNRVHESNNRPSFLKAARVSDWKTLEGEKTASVADEPSRVSGDNGSHNSHDQRLFSDVVGDRKNPVLSFYPLNNKNDSVVEIPLELAQEASKPFQTTAYGYFLGPRVYFPIVERSVKAAWGKYGCSEVMLNGNGTYFFKFNDVGGRDHVVESGPLMIRGVPLFVFPWDATKGLRIPEHTSCPLWVKLYNIPLVAFNLEGICRIASAIGEPRQLDACTAAMCDKLWGRTGFAKVLIDVWAVGELKKEVEVVIPNLSGGPSERIKVKVEYVWEPSQCSLCCVFGHKTNSCPKKSSQKKVIKGKENEDREGFVQVIKKQWRRKTVQPNANMESTRKGPDWAASTSHVVSNEKVNLVEDPSRKKGSVVNAQPMPLPKADREADKGKEKVNEKLAGC